MKKKFTKKLNLNKATITRLLSNDMEEIKGAYSFETCGCDTASCSIVVFCCVPNTKEKNIDQELIRG